MIDNFLASPLFWITLTIGSYLLGNELNKRWPNPLFTPLIFAIVSLILLLLSSRIPYATYAQGGQYLSFWITPATVALAIKLEEHYAALRQYFKEILSGILLGVCFHLSLVYLFAWLFRLDLRMILTTIPKSITTAIAMGISDSLGGIVSITITMVLITGIFGAAIASSVFRYCGIDDEIAQGIALGSAAHAMGTSRAVELGGMQGAMSSVALILSGIFTVILSPFFLYLTLIIFG